MKPSSYSGLVQQLQALKPQDAAFARKLNELISITELLTTLNTARTLEETLDIMLLTILGEYGCRKGAILVKTPTAWRIGIGKGLRKEAIPLEKLTVGSDNASLPALIRKEDEAARGLEALLAPELFELLLPVKNEKVLVGLICVGASMLPNHGTDKESLLVTIADFGGVLIGNSLYRQDLERVNRQLQRQLFQLNTLYEIAVSFARCYEDDAVFQILSKNLMGQFAISRCAVLVFEDTCHAVYHKGLKPETTRLGRIDDLLPLKDWGHKVLDLDQVACPGVAAFMKAEGLHYALPIASQDAYFGLLLLGGRLDRKKLTAADRNFILSIAQQSAVALENIRLQKEAVEKKRLERELNLAREIQQKLLPKGVPNILGYEIAAEMRPYDQVGGDFYDFLTLEDGRLGFCLADVSGKSLPASMIMSTAQASLRALNSFAGLSPQRIIEKLNIHLCQSTQSNKFVTLFFAVLDPDTHLLTYINAGHNRPILVRPDRSTVLLDKGGMVLGLFPMATYLVDTVCLDEGAKILMYTDGLSEVVNQNEEEFGDDRLLTTFLNFEGTADQEKNYIVHRVMDFSANTMVDDLTLLIIKRRKRSG